MIPLVVKGSRERFLVEESELRTRQRIAGELLTRIEFSEQQAKRLLDLRIPSAAQRQIERAEILRDVLFLVSGGAK